MIVIKPESKCLYKSDRSNKALDIKYGPDSAYGFMCADSRTGKVFSPEMAHFLLQASVTKILNAPCPNLTFPKGDEVDANAKDAVSEQWE